MLNLNLSTLDAVVAQALQDAADHPRWLVAIDRAERELNTNPWIERGDLHGLVIGSPSGKCYAANGECQCTAFEFKTPCWHRAAARLVRLHDERELQAAYNVAADAGLFGPADNDYSYLIDDDRGPFPLNLPDDDRVEESNRAARLEAARAATDALNECYS